MTAPIYLPDEQHMLDAGARLAPLLLSGPQSGAGALIYLHGELGAGKTTLVRGLLRAAGVTGTVRSPTYTLVEPYDIQLGHTDARLFHLDLYRLADPEELEDLGWWELHQDGGVLMIEWPERGTGVLPAPDLEIQIALQPPGRTLTLTGRRAWHAVAQAAHCALSEQRQVSSTAPK